MIFEDARFALPQPKDDNLYLKGGLPRECSVGVDSVLVRDDLPELGPHLPRSIAYGEQEVLDK